MKKISIYILIALLGSFVMSSCKDDDIEKEILPIGEAAGSWFVTEVYTDGSDYGPYHITTYNTATRIDSFWINNIYDDGIVVKALLNSDKTFSAEKAVDQSGHYSSVSIQNGQIVGKDSIYFEVTIFDEEGAVEDQFNVGGHRETGFEE